MKKSYDYVIRYNIKEKKYELFKRTKKVFLRQTYYKETKVTDNSVCLKYKINEALSGYSFKVECPITAYLNDYTRHITLFTFMNENFEAITSRKVYSLGEREAFLYKERTEAELLEIVEKVNMSEKQKNGKFSIKKSLINGKNSEEELTK